MSDRATLTQDLEAVLRAHGAALRDLGDVLQGGPSEFGPAAGRVDVG